MVLFFKKELLASLPNTSATLFVEPRYIMTKRILQTGVILASFAMAAHAYAAPQPAPASATAPALPKDAAADVDKHITELHDQLGITSEQQAPWDQFADVMRGNAAAMHAAMEDRGSKMTSMSAADNMQSYADLAKVHAENMQKLATSFGTLYTSLSDEQKRTANSVFRHQHAKHEAMSKHAG